MRVVSALVSLCVLSVLGAGCRDQTQFRPVVDGGIVCGENQRLMQGECRFVCDRDAVCPATQRCNLLLGQCEPKPPVPDSGPVTVPCTTGAERCAADNGSVERCDSEGRWQVEQECPKPGGFCLNEKCLACQPGATRCDPADAKQVIACKDDGSGTRTITCSGAAQCAEGECRECVPNTTRCSPSGTTVQLCQKSPDETLSWRWVDNGDAYDGSCITQKCQQTGTGVAQCVAPACFPGVTQCKDSKTQQICGNTGAWSDVVCTTLPGFSPAAECLNGVCIDECGDAAQQKSYFGCEYWTTTMDNWMFPVHKGGTTSGQGTQDSQFAFVVSNRSERAATVTIHRWTGPGLTLLKTVPLPGKSDPATKGVAVIRVPWQSIGPSSANVSTTGTARYGMRLTTTRPVTVYQFNPLGAVMYANNCNNDNDCSAINSPPPPNGAGGKCQAPAGQTQKVCHYWSFSNDASLLLPAHILGTSYVAMAPEEIEGKGGLFGSPPSSKFSGMITIVGTADGTTVTVKSSAVTAAGGPITAMAKGDTRTFTINSFDVLQFASALPNPIADLDCASDPFSSFGEQLCRVNNDLTGTVVSSDKPIAVFGGSSCHLVPHAQAACDHLEEQLFPFVTWGKTFAAVRSAPLRLSSGKFATATQAAPDHYKVVAGCPATVCPTGTGIKISPAAAVPAAGSVLGPNKCASGSLSTNDCRLMGGAFMEFKSKDSFMLTADQPVAVGQFFAGENATSVPLDPPAQGDPSFVLLPPMEQWRSSYTVLTAPGIRDNYLGLVFEDAKVASVEVDGTAVTGFTAINATLGDGGTTSLQVKNHPVSVGTHTILVIPKAGVSPLPGAGVTVYGFDSYVSYGYTGGLDLSTIVTGINPGG